MKIITNQLTKSQNKAVYTASGKKNGKPHFTTPTKQVLSKSTDFAQKQLCTGSILNLGLGCGFQCTYCYVPNQMARHAVPGRIQKKAGLSLGEISLLRKNPLPVLESELLYADGSPRFTAKAVVFTSTLVDPCANKEILDLTLGACRLVLQHTPWTIRVLTKSAAVVQLARGLEDFKSRVIYGLSTGTFDDRVARHVENGASLPTARIGALKTMHHEGFQTFGMVCPILPQNDYDRFANEVAERILPHVSENIWAEVINARGEAFKATIAALGKAGAEPTQVKMQRVNDDKAAWEVYARTTFEALAKVIPNERFRFLQYVQKGQSDWWQAQVIRGAVLLGKFRPSAPASATNSVLVAGTSIAISAGQTQCPSPAPHSPAPKSIIGKSSCMKEDPVMMASSQADVGGDVQAADADRAHCDELYKRLWALKIDKILKRMNRLGVRGPRNVLMLNENPSASDMRQVWDFESRKLSEADARSRLLSWRAVLIEGGKLNQEINLYHQLFNQRKRQAWLIGRFAAMREYTAPGRDGMAYRDPYRKITNNPAWSIVVLHSEKCEWKNGRRWPSKRTISYRICLLPKDWQTPLTIESKQTKYNFKTFANLAEQVVYVPGPVADNQDLHPLITATLL